MLVRMTRAGRPCYACAVEANPGLGVRSRWDWWDAGAEDKGGTPLLRLRDGGQPWARGRNPVGIGGMLVRMTRAGRPCYACAVQANPGGAIPLGLWGCWYG